MVHSSNFETIPVIVGHSISKTQRPLHSSPEQDPLSSGALITEALLTMPGPSISGVTVLRPGGVSARPRRSAPPADFF